MLKNRLLVIVVAMFMALACVSHAGNDAQVFDKTESVATLLNLEQANRLAQLPLDCINTEFPNKLNDVLGSANDLATPKELHPAFYGCFDWHSAVHGHWSLVKLLKLFPELKNTDEIRKKLLANISKANMQKEILFFQGPNNRSWERTYGWAWYLKLVEELHTWDDPLARELETHLTPLAELLVERYFEFLPKLYYPIRIGEHPNTAFGLNFAWDYAQSVGDEKFSAVIKNNAQRYFAKDSACPINYEPSGFDFLSPCLEEAALMRRILATNDFRNWMKNFLPQLSDKSYQLPVGRVSDRNDGKLVHLDGVNFSRAWSLAVISKDLPEYAHLKDIARQHINYSLPSIVGDSYEGGHWLGSFAIYALDANSD